MASDTINKPGDKSSIECLYLGVRCIYDIRNVSDFSFHVYLPGVAWPSGTVPVLKVRYGNSTEDFQDVGTAVTFSAYGITELLNVTKSAYICLEVTTASASSFIPTVVGYGK